MKYVLILVGVLLAGCTKQNACDAAKAVTNGVALEVAKQLDCKDLDAIKATIQVQLEKIKVCDSAASIKSPIGDFVCAPLVDGLIGAAQTQIPSEWKCSGGTGKELVKTKLLEICQKAL